MRGGKERGSAAIRILAVGRGGLVGGEDGGGGLCCDYTQLVELHSLFVGIRAFPASFLNNSYVGVVVVIVVVDVVVGVVVVSKVLYSPHARTIPHPADYAHHRQ